METKILVTGLNHHRNNLQEVELMIKALLQLGYKVTNNVNDNYSLAIVWNAKLDGAERELYGFIVNKANKVLYMYVDCDLPIPPSDCVLVSQFFNIGDIYFPISKLAVFHKLWDKPIEHIKTYKGIYGGTFKDRRDYRPLLKIKDLLLSGDSDEWDNYSEYRIPTVRCLDMWYHLQAMCYNTYIVYDPMHYNNNIPARFYECVFTNTDCVVFHKDGSETIYTSDSIKKSVNKTEYLRQIKDLIERFNNGTSNN